MAKKQFDGLRNAGRARAAALKLVILATLAGTVLDFIVWTVKFHPLALGGLVNTIWFLFILFTLYFFRDPTPACPDAPGLVVAPGTGKVDVVDKLEKSDYMGGPCHRVSIFLSVVDVHVQNAPISGKVTCVTHTPGKFLSAVASDCAAFNENVLIGFNSTETPGEKVGLRLVAGLIARRIVPFVKVGDEMVRGERISLIQFGSRCDIYIPLAYQIKASIGDKVVGGETILASK
jgi:phosphatidylserine decarboxylase